MYPVCTTCNVLLPGLGSLLEFMYIHRLLLPACILLLRLFLSLSIGRVHRMVATW